MSDFFTVDNIFTLFSLILLQAVLGFDNLLYISLESKKAPEADRSKVRRVGILIAIALRIGLLIVLTSLIDYFEDPLFSINAAGYIEGSFNLYSIVVLFGGGFILYTAIREIWHMMSLEVHAHDEVKPKSTKAVIFWIVAMNLIFSFDSILSAMALTDNIWTMAIAIIISGFLMIWLADRVSSFLQKNRMYEVLGLFVLFLVGVMLISESGHEAHMSLFDQAIHKMNKATFYFILAILVIVDIAQSRYQKRLSKQQELEGKLED